MNTHKYDYDLFVIGGGSGGIRAARWSASLGAKVALCEYSRLGGTCVIRGCIPKKLMAYGAEFSDHFKHSQSYGWEWDKEPRLNWESFNQTRDKEIKRLEGIYSNLLKNSGVNCISGKGILKDPHSVEVNGETHTSRFILIAVGGWPSALNIPGGELAISSNEIFSLSKQPSSLLVIGAGYIGVEFASIFQGLGTKVQLMFRRDFILRGFDQDIRKTLQEELEKKQVQMLSNRSPLKLAKNSNQIHITDDRGEVWHADTVLMATGRKAHTKDLNLKALGIETTKQGTIQVNERFETSCPGVFALGDCASTPYELTPVATAEGMVLSEFLFAKDQKRKITYENIPTAVFTHPPVGTVGLTEEEALKQNHQIEVFESRFRPLKITLTEEQEKTYMKLIVCKESQKVLGCHMVGEGAAEILQGFAVALKAGLTKAHFDQTIGIHPTSAEELVTLRTSRK